MENPANLTFFRNAGYSSLLLLKKPSMSNYFLFSIDRFTGSLSFDGVLNSSVFSDYDSAIAHISGRFNINCNRPEFVGEALIGITRFGPVVYIAYVKSSAPVARIQNRHVIRNITETSFITINLPFNRQPTAKDQRRIGRLKEFPIADSHFYCESADLSKPTFISRHDSGFVWNEYWALPFARIGQRDACIDLLQGVVSSRIVSVGLDILKLTVIATREAHHGGARYYARGLDQEGHAANEVSLELLAETNSGRIWSHVIRRGSVPVGWRTIVAKNLPTVSVSVDTDFARMTPTYFSRLGESYSGRIVCLNLLHNGAGNSELPLCDAFAKSVSSLLNVVYTELDFHQAVKDAGIAGAVGRLFDLIGTPDLTSSQVDPPLPNSNERFRNSPYAVFGNEDYLPELVPSQFAQIQENVLRVNCMDSLDRTNVACFFAVAKAVSGVLTQLVGTPIIESYSDLLCLPVEIRNFLAEAFIHIGDCISNIYTNTGACMTDIFMNTCEVDLRKYSDSQIAVQRRFHNFVTDKKRQKSFCMFLGQRLGDLLPGLVCGFPEHLVSSFPGCSIPPVFFTGFDGNDARCLIESVPCTVTSMSPTTLLFALKEYCFVTAIVVVVAPPCPPCCMRVYTALTHGPRLVALNKAAIPQVVEAETPVYFTIPPDCANGHQFLSRYVYIEFSSADSNKEISLSNIFIYGSNSSSLSSNSLSYSNSSNSNYSAYSAYSSYVSLPSSLLTQQLMERFPRTYQPIERVHPSRNCEKKMETTPPDIIIRQISRFDFSNVIRLETSRLVHRVGRLETCARILQNGLNPLDFSLAKQRACCMPGFRTQAEKCSMCEKPAMWRCFNCQAAFCSSGCSDFHQVDDEIYFNMPATICDECNKKYIGIIDSVSTLSYLYSNFYKLSSPSEAVSNEFVSNFLKNNSFIHENNLISLYEDGPEEINNNIINTTENNINTDKFKNNINKMKNGSIIKCTENCNNDKNDYNHNNDFDSDSDNNEIDNNDNNNKNEFINNEINNNENNITDNINAENNNNHNNNVENNNNTIVDNDNDKNSSEKNNCEKFGSATKSIKPIKSSYSPLNTNNSICVKRLIKYDPSVFPFAFFTNADDPKLNLVLTQDGGSLSAPATYQLCLHFPLIVQTVFAEGSDDLSLIIRQEQQYGRSELSMSGRCNTSKIDPDSPLQGQFFYVVVKKGVLAKLRLAGTPKIEEVSITSASTNDVQSKNLMMLEKHFSKEIKGKFVQSPIIEKSICLEFRKKENIHGVCFRDLIGVNSILFAFYSSKINENPSLCDFYYIPKGVTNFYLNFTKEVKAKLIAVQFYDTEDVFIEPKISVF